VEKELRPAPGHGPDGGNGFHQSSRSAVTLMDDPGPNHAAGRPEECGETSRKPVDIHASAGVRGHGVAAKCVMRM